MTLSNHTSHALNVADDLVRRRQLPCLVFIVFAKINMSNQVAEFEDKHIDSLQDRASLLRVMAHPMRLNILEKLCQRPHCVKHLNALIDIAQPQLSQHMATLRKAKLVACHACGPVRCYYISRPTLVKSIIQLLREDHQYLEMDCDSIVAEARQGWDEEIGNSEKVSLNK